MGYLIGFFISGAILMLLTIILPNIIATIADNRQERARYQPENTGPQKGCLGAFFLICFGIAVVMILASR